MECFCLERNFHFSVVGTMRPQYVSLRPNGPKSKSKAIDRVPYQK